MPNLPEHAIAILTPLVIPKPQFLDALGCKKLLAYSIVLSLLGQPVF